MTRGISKYSLILLLLLLPSGCDRDVLYTGSVNIPSELWQLDFIPEFRPEIKDTAQICNINLTIRTGTSYPFRNIWLFVKTVSPSGKSITDTLQFNLADEKGKWFGKGFGDIHELNLPLRSGVFFPEKGTYIFSVRHGMRTENLPGVYDLGLRITSVKK